ncbi:MAG: DUF5906 domain-containing protein [Candidatus Parvarchaeota archaeon]
MTNYSHEPFRFSSAMYTLQEWFGYHLWNGLPVEKSLLLVGDNHSNGKSILLHVLTAFIGEKNISHLSLQQLTANGDHSATSNLYGKIANIYGDLSAEEVNRLGSLKLLTGNDQLICTKNQKPFYFKNYAKFTFSTNTFPVVPSSNATFRQRWIVIRVSGSFNDPDLLEKLTTPEELSGILNWALEGLKRLRENGWVFSDPNSGVTI